MTAVLLLFRGGGTVSQNVTVALSGVSATGSTGSLTPALSLALTEVAGTGSPGSLGDGDSDALTQVAGTGSLGTLIPASAVGLAQVAGSGAVGSVVAADSIALSQVAGTGAVGLLFPAIDLPLTEVAGLGSVGNLTPQTGSDVTVALSGVSGSGAVGSLTASASAAVREFPLYWPTPESQRKYGGIVKLPTKVKRATLDDVLRANGIKAPKRKKVAKAIGLPLDAPATEAEVQAVAQLHLLTMPIVGEADASAIDEARRAKDEREASEFAVKAALVEVYIAAYRELQDEEDLVALLYGSVPEHIGIAHTTVDPHSELQDEEDMIALLTWGN
jgi:hypothetical protein